MYLPSGEIAAPWTRSLIPGLVTVIACGGAVAGLRPAVLENQSATAVTAMTTARRATATPVLCCLISPTMYSALEVGRTATPFVVSLGDSFLGTLDHGTSGDFISVGLSDSGLVSSCCFK